MHSRISAVSEREVRRGVEPTTVEAMLLRRSLTMLVIACGLAVLTTASVVSAPPAAADVDDFSFDAWHIEYDVSLEDGRAKLHATETITAAFPDADQNRGIVRGLPASYQNVPTNVEVLSVTDGSGGEISWELDRSGSEVLVLTGDDDYVRGTQTYVIEYTMDDVVLAAEQTGLDEFYWDLLPADREQTIRDFTASITFDEALTAELTGDSACYQGQYGSSDRCDLEGPAPQPDGSSAFTLAIDALPAGAGATVAIGMTPGTVTQPEERELGGADYRIDEWDAEYRIGLDSEGYSVMHATETMVVTFPDADRSRGIQLRLDTILQRASTDVEVLSVADENGNDLPWQVEEREAYIDISAGAASSEPDEYLHGSYTFVVDYTMRNVVTMRSVDAGEGPDADDMFRWVLLPGGAEPVSAFSAQVIFDETLSGAVTGDHQCTGDCELSGPEDTAEGTVFTVSSVELDDGSGVNRNPADSSAYAVVQINVAAGAVTQPLERRYEPVITVLPHVLAWGGVAVGGIGGVAAIVMMQRRAKRAGESSLPEYEVPTDLPPVVATVLGAGTAGVESAQIMHLAVNSVTRFTEIKEASSKGFDVQRASLQVELVQPVRAAEGAEKFDLLTQRALFDARPEVGATRKLEGNDQELTSRMQMVRKAGAREAISRGLIVQRRSRAAIALACIGLLAALVSLGLGIVGLSLSMRGGEAAMVSAVLATVVLAVLLLICCSRFNVVTPEGAQAAARLTAVKRFIRSSETERLGDLQSYTAAERRSDGDVDVIRVYEKLLPYAMLSGRIKNWSEVLRVAYEDADAVPRWASRTDLDMSAMLVSVTGSLQDASVTSSGSSSGAGGSTGGGFSGGGGGGGSVGGR